MRRVAHPHPNRTQAVAVAALLTSVTPSPNSIEIKPVRHEGYLEKQRRVKTWAWKKYWFTLEDGQLAYFKDETKLEGVGLIDLGQAISIKAQPNGPRNYSFDITMKGSKIHNFCTESETLKDQWIRLLLQARLERVLRPNRSSSMMRPRCNSIDEQSGVGEIMFIEDLEPMSTPTSPPSTPGSATSSSGPTTPTSPLKLGSPKFQKATKQNPLVHSPKFQKAFPKGPNSPKAREFLDQPAWVTGKVIASSAPSSDAVELKGIRRLVPDKAVHEQSKPAQVETPDVHTNSAFDLPLPDVTTKKRPTKTKSPATAMRCHNVVSRVSTGLFTSLVTDNNNTNNNRFVKQGESVPNLTRPAVTRAKSQHTVVSRTYTPCSRPMSGPGNLVRAHPVSGQRPTIEPRASTYKPCSLSTSSESESENPTSSRQLKRLCSNDSDVSHKSDIIPSKSSTTGVVLRRKLATTKSLPFFGGSVEGSSSDSETERENQDLENNNKEYVDEVFAAAPTAMSSPVLRYTLRVKDDEYYETLCKLLREPLPPIPNLRYPRLELTFRSAFDDIRLFLANNRGCDEIFPVPRLSERGGKAIRKLQKALETLS